jgi:hypothetical protein
MTLQERINKCPNNKVPLLKGDRVDYVWPQYVDQYVTDLGYTKATKQKAPAEVADADEVFADIVEKAKKGGRKPKAIESDEQQ